MHAKRTAATHMGSLRPMQRTFKTPERQATHQCLSCVVHVPVHHNSSGHAALTYITSTQCAISNFAKRSQASSFHVTQWQHMMRCMH
jgi:hypothetical protein